jgi:S1-C subfamily serine protease
MKLIIFLFALFFYLSKISIRSFLLKRNNQDKEISDFPLKEWQTNIDLYKQSVVMIEIESDMQFFDEQSTMSLATGFIIDKDLGLIATNRHVTRRSPSKHKIKFYDGTVHMGNVVYYDIFHDFGIIKIKNFEELKKDSKFYNYLKQVKIGTSYSLKKGTELFLIGNNEGVNYSVKTGNVLEVNIPDSLSFGSLIQTSFDRTGGSSGSPVWDYNGNVVAIHAMGDNINSLEVPIDYLADVLNYIKHNQNKIKEGKYSDNNLFNYDKGFIGAITTTIPLFKIKRLIENIPNKNSDLQQIQTIVSSYNSTQKENPEIILIQNIIDDSPASNKLRAGDIIIKINDEVIGNDLIKHEKILDSNIQKNIKFTVFRFGEILDYNIQVVGTKNEKIKEFIVIKNTILHEIKLGYRMKYGYVNQGIYISQIGLSSPFSDITPEEMKNKKTDGDIVIVNINSNKITSLNSFVEVLNNMCDRSNLYIQAIDLNFSLPRPDIYPIDFGDINEIFKFTFNEQEGGWKNTKISLKSCVNKKNLRIDHSNSEKDKQFFNNFYSRMKLIKKYIIRSFK